ncbi:MAG TPA: LPS assembly lipoprotein LptE [Bryobacteraceae bacterium]|nr:LPS assembly lipoprotein LptE [Bryobacteraceae bacterium]
MLQAKFVALLLVASGLVCLSSCGYHTGAKGDLVPKSVQTIAVMPFHNLSTRYRLSDALQQAISREFIARTRFQVVRDKTNADAILDGTISRVLQGPMVFDPATGKATIVSISVFLQISLTERATGKVIYSQPSLNVHNNYEIALNANQYFDESALALQRVSSDVARMVVSGIMENF